MRLGEKLHEELAAPEERPEPTGIEKVMVLRNGDLGAVLSEAEEMIRLSGERPSTEKRSSGPSRIFPPRV